MIGKEEIEKLRTTYAKSELTKAGLLNDPLGQVRLWFKQALDANIYEANAMALSTVSDSSQPSSRIVLLKGIDESGLLFYTNYHSKKGQELASNPKASILFFWKELERQIRIEGTVEKISEEQSKEYFQSRPKGSQLGAWASGQSDVILDRAELEDRLSELKDIYQNYDVLPKPAHWGGYRLIPQYYEFWQGRPNRLHDRFEYKRENEDWVINRLAP